MNERENLLNMAKGQKVKTTTKENEENKATTTKENKETKKTTKKNSKETTKSNKENKENTTKSVDDPTEGKIWEKSPARTGMKLTFIKSLEVEKYRKDESSNKESAMEDENMFISKHLKYTVKRIALVSNEAYKDLDKDEISDEYISIVYKVVEIPEEFKPYIKVKKNTEYAMTLKEFNEKFTRIGYDYCNCCKQPIKEKHITYLKMALESKYLNEKYKNVIRRYEGKLCMSCQYKESISEEGRINVDDKSKNSKSLYNAMKGALIKERIVNGECMAKKITTCGNCGKRTLDIAESESFMRIYKEQLEKLGVSEKFLCNHCIDELIDTKTVIKQSNQNRNMFLNSLSKEDREKFEEEVNGILNSLK